MPDQTDQTDQTEKIDKTGKQDKPDRPDEAPPEVDTPMAPPHLTALARMQEAIYYAIAVVLLLLSAGALVHTVVEFVAHDERFAERVTGVVNGVLFVVIILELLRTVLAHFENASFQLKPFMIIGIISVVRHILTVGAELSLRDDSGRELWSRADVELGVNALVVLVLVIGLVLLRETE